jgi:hypothetical protein
MVTPSGTITMANVNQELGRLSTASVNMNETAVRALARVPAGTISMNDLRNKKFIDFPGFSVFSYGTPSYGEYAGALLDISSDGTTYGIDLAGLGYNIVYTNAWLPTIEPSIIDDYEARATLVSGNSPSGTLNTWLNLSTSRQWSIDAFYPSSSSSIIQIQIRNAATGIVLQTGNVTLSASS